MYTVYADDELIYTPDVEELCLYNIVLTMEDNSAGMLTFNMTSAHPAFTSLKKLATMIKVKDSGRTIWKGRIISDDRNIDNIKTIQCEGKLAFLNDSIFPEFEFSGAPELLFRRIMENHNSQVGEKQRFLIGNVTVKDKNDYIVRSSDSALKTWKAVKEKCFQSSLGGHLQIRYEADGDYIDWLEDYQEISSQPISFGENIIDLLVNTSAAETYTAIRPQGATVNGRRINITAVNDGKDYIINEERAAEYGIIYAEPDESIWDDVTLPGNLLRKALEKLNSGITLKKSIEVRAIDLNLTDKQTEALRVCTYVRVVSAPHGIEAWYLLSKAEIHIDAPENTQYTLGAVKAALTDTNKETKSAIEKVMSTAIPTDVSQLKNDANYTTVPEVVQIIEQSGMSAPVISVVEETENTYILQIGTAVSTFSTPNLKGQAGDAGKSAYEMAQANGFTGTEAEWLDSLKGDPGEKGWSAYEMALANGFTGTEEEWLATLKGAPGKDAPIQIDGIEGTEGAILQFKDGHWQGIIFENDGAECIILGSVEKVMENEEPEKLVDALVIKQVFQCVSEGKRLIALAVTGKGVDTSAEDTFVRMAEKIGMIQEGIGGDGAVMKQLNSFSMAAPEGEPQIITAILGLLSGGGVAVKSCMKENITVTEG